MFSGENSPALDDWSKGPFTLAQINDVKYGRHGIYRHLFIQKSSLS